MKILLIKMRYIGDVLLATPIIRNLARAYPGADIDIAVISGTQDLVTQNPNIRKVLIYEGKKHKKKSIFRRFWTEFKFFCEIKREKYDLAIQLTGSEHGVLLAKYAGIPKIVAFDNIKRPKFNKHATNVVWQFDGDKHAIDRNLDALRWLKIPIKSKRVEIYFDPMNLSEFPIPARFVHFHATSRFSYKSVNAQFMASLIDFCELELRVKAVLTAADSFDEKKRIDEILSLCTSKPLNLAGKLTLKQVANLAFRAEIYVGVDTGISHIAAAVNTPVIALFGLSNPNEWGPWDNSLTKNGYEKPQICQRMGQNCAFKFDARRIEECEDLRNYEVLKDFTPEQLEAVKSEIKAKLG